MIERYGWTYEQLDESDEDRVMTGYVLQNLRERLGRIKGWLATQGKGVQLSEEDLRLYGMVTEAKEELDAGRE